MCLSVSAVDINMGIYPAGACAGKMQDVAVKPTISLSDTKQ